MGKPVEHEPDAAGRYRAKAGSLGLLIIEEENAREALIWLLDGEGRTNGPVWLAEIAAGTALAAAAGLKKIIDGTSENAAFTMWPPGAGARDVATEDILNDAWGGVLKQIDGLRLTAGNEAQIAQAIRTVNSYIDRLAQSEAGATLAMFSQPFKLEAAKLVRRKAGAHPST
jgi:hypothetical protein